MVIRLTLVWILAAFAVPAFAVDVDGFRVWTDPDKTRAVLDLDSKTEYQLFTLDDPPRVVIDLPKSSLAHSLGFEAEHAGVIDGVRHGAPDKNTLRIVLDLESQSEIKSQAQAESKSQGKN